VAQQRALPATASTHDDESFAAVNGKGNVINDGAIAERPPQIGNFDNRRVRHDLMTNE
jgi:hypothetical protein